MRGSCASLPPRTPWSPSPSSSWTGVALAAKRRGGRSPPRSRDRSSRPRWASEQEDPPIEQPVVLGKRYRIERELGRGGMAKVYLGTDTVLGRTVAIKMLAPQFADDGGFVQRFRREAQAAASISHPHIVSVFDTGSDDGL